MAAVAITDNNTRRQDMEGAVTGTTNIGSGAGPNTFTESFYQNTQSWGRKAGGTNSQRGFFITITSIDMTAANNRVLLHKASIVNDGQLATYANGGGLRARIGSSTSNYYGYAITSDQGDAGDTSLEYGGRKWRITPIDPSVTAWVDVVTTAPTLTAITEIAVTGSVTSTTNLENVLIDAIDFGPGLYMVGGDGADADGLIADFVTDDEGTIAAGRFGHIFTQDKVVFVFGTLYAGRDSTPTTTATVLTDSLRTLVWPGGLVDAGWNGLYWDLGNATTAITLSQMNYSGEGRDDKKIWFDSANEVDGTNEEIDAVGHGYATGDAVLYSDEGGTAVSGLTDATEYFVERVNADAFSLHATRQAALTLATPIGLTAAGTAEQHSFRRQPTTLPDAFSTGTAGSWTETGSIFRRCRNITLTSAVTHTGCSYIACKLLTTASGTVADATVASPFITEGEYFIDSTDMDDVTGTAFEIGTDGHAWRRSGTAGTDAINGHSYTGYWTHGGDPGDGARFDTTSGVDAGTDVITTDDTHGFSTGDAVFYEDHGGTATPLGSGTDGLRFYVRALTTTTLAIYNTKYQAVNDTGRRALTSAGAESHALYSSKAAGVNDTGGAMTFNVTGAGDTPYVRNIGASSSTVTAAVSITVTPLATNSEVRVYAAGTANELDGIEDSIGSSFVFSVGSGVSVDVVILNVDPVHGPKVPIRLQAQSYTVDQNLDPRQQNDANFSDPD